MKYSLRQHLIKEDQQVMSPAQAFVQDIGNQADRFVQDYDAEITLIDGDCITTLSIEIPSEQESPSYAHIGYIEVTNKNGKADPNCFRKGYASSMMRLVADGADKHNVTLGLSAESPTGYYREVTYGTMDVPDNDELSRFYSKFGFVETNRNSEQIYMKRTPSSI